MPTKNGSSYKVTGLVVIAEPGMRTMVKQGTRSSPFAFMQGPDGNDIACDKCGFVLCTGMEPGMVQNMVFVCPNCRTSNDVTHAPLEGTSGLPSLNPHDYARMDGVTDDTEALQAVLERVGDNGARIVCGAGVAVINRPLKVKRRTRIGGLR